VADELHLITAAEMDEMTPDERLETLRARVITNWDDAPTDLRERAAAVPPPVIPVKT
jgi:hypothetical protein